MNGTAKNHTGTNFDGKVCLITGASSGIGLAYAHHFLAQGATVFTAQRSQSDNRFNFIKADFEHTNTPQQVIEDVNETAGKLDVLVNNAGIMQEGFAENTSLDAHGKKP